MRSDAAEAELRQAGYDVHSWSNQPGFWYPVHGHPYDKRIVVLQGSITFYLPDRREEHRLAAGQQFDIPAGAAHSATVGVDGVACLEGQRVTR